MIIPVIFIPRPSLNQTGESEECDGHQSCCDQNDGRSLERMGHIVILDLFTDTGKQDDGDRKSNRNADTIDNALNKVIFLLHIGQGHA